MEQSIPTMELLLLGLVCKRGSLISWWGPICTLLNLSDPSSTYLRRLRHSNAAATAVLHLLVAVSLGFVAVGWSPEAS
ncbi:hypothetical protein EJB05_37521 [Eragrostis curvula]|uniref:Uncharacterized protein n=1 Tax=Eragrostis curvula TaxID=38414 RepID=A0A5J9TS29_9POAL|nr:hypothetical protein EJB05_37521 [Eragrostis curvula]